MFSPARLLQTWKWSALFLSPAGRITAILSPESYYFYRNFTLYKDEGPTVS